MKQVDTQFDADGGAGRAGTYRCVADNGYSSDTASFQLHVNNSPFTPLALMPRLHDEAGFTS